jgi:predicted Rossmann fold nucleotide-binding protein DprA/Smf involved in DNA uptake
MDEHLGNLELLDRPMVAFFASRETPEEEAKCALKWAEQVSTSDKVVISGFHSPLEKGVLNILLEHKHPVVIVLGRTLYKRVPKQYAEPLSEGRMLIMNVRNVSRNNYRSSQLRNFVVADYADECIFAGLHKGSSLDVLYDIRLSKSRRVEEIIIVQ